MRQVIFLIIWSGLSSIGTQAQISTSARLLGMGAVGAANRSYIGDMLGNPAAITSNHHPALMAGHHYMYYQPEVSSQLLSFVLPFQRVQMGLVAVHFGLESAYRFTSLGYLYGQRFGPYLSVAWAVHYRRFQIPNYREDQGVAMDIGLHYICRPGWTVGVAFRRLSLVPSVGDFQHTAPSEVRIGVMGHAGAGLKMALDLSYRKANEINLYGGLDYAFVPDLFFMRLGLSTENKLSPFAGLGLSWEKFRIDAGSSFHAALGMSPQIDVSYVFQK